MNNRLKHTLTAAHGTPHRPWLPRGWRQWLQFGVTAVLMVALVLIGLVFQYQEIGMYVIFGYGLLAFVLRIKSDTTFKMVLIILVCMPVLSMRGDDELISTLSVYALLLAGIGTVSLIIEHIISGKKYI